MSSQCSEEKFAGLTVLALKKGLGSHLRDGHGQMGEYWAVVNLCQECALGIWSTEPGWSEVRRGGATSFCRLWKLSRTAQCTCVQ